MNYKNIRNRNKRITAVVYSVALLPLGLLLKLTWETLFALASMLEFLGSGLERWDRGVARKLSEWERSP